MPPPPNTHGCSWFDWIRWILIVGLSCWTSGTWGDGANATVAVLAPGRITAYKAVIEAMSANRLGGVTVYDSDQPDSVERLTRANPTLVVSLGISASQLAVDRLADVPLLVGLVSRSRYRQLAGSRHATSAVFLEQPLPRLLTLARVALPRLEPIGLLVSDTDSRQEIQARLSSSPDQQLLLHCVDQGQDFESALRTLLEQTRLLVAFHDADIFNRTRLPVVLLSSYHYSVPVIGYTRSMVEAGAALGLYTTAEQFGAQLARAARGFLTGAVPAPSYPDQFEIMINARVSRSLGLELPDEQTLKAILLRTLQ